MTENGIWLLRHFPSKDLAVRGLCFLLPFWYGCAFLQANHKKVTEAFKERITVASRICIIVAFTIALLIAGRVIIIPLAVSFLFAMVLNPFLIRLEKMGINRLWSIVLVMLAFLLIIAGFMMFSYYQISMLMEDLPNIKERTWNRFGTWMQEVERFTGFNLGDQEQWVGENGENTTTFLTGFLQITTTVLTGLVQIPIYIFLFLLYKDKFQAFIERLYHGNKKISNEHIEEVREVVQGYVFGMFLVICILAVLNSIGLLLLGIKYAIFFGVFSAILTVIPYIGNIVGGLLPFIMALVTKDSAWYGVGVVAVYGLVQFLEGNFITPKVMGSKVSINPLVALIALIAGGQILGVAGLIIAIPLVGILKVALSHSETLKPLTILMEEGTTNT